MNRPVAAAQQPSWTELHNEIDASAPAGFAPHNRGEHSTHIPGNEVSFYSASSRNARDRPPPYPVIGNRSDIDTAAFAAEAAEEQEGRDVAATGSAFHDEQAWWNEQLQQNQRRTPARAFFRPIVTPSAPHCEHYSSSRNGSTKVGGSSGSGVFGKKWVHPGRPMQQRRKQILVTNAPTAANESSWLSALSAASPPSNDSVYCRDHSEEVNGVGCGNAAGSANTTEDEPEEFGCGCSWGSCLFELEWTSGTGASSGSDRHDHASSCNPPLCVCLE